MTAELETESFDHLSASFAANADAMQCIAAEKASVAALDIYNALISLYDANQSAHLSRFFKTGKGEYGEGDSFLGIKVPQTRAIVKAHQRKGTLADVDILTRSAWHEVRLAGFLLLITKYDAAKRTGDSRFIDDITNYYLSIIDRGNNWDLVDVVCPYVLGDYINDNPQNEHILYTLASDDNLWRKRVSIVATITLIRHGKFNATLSLCKSMLTHPHDLIHKAIGWMLREVGKKDLPTLKSFLDTHAGDMPRVALRYAIERLSAEQRRHYMARPFKPIN